MHWAGQSGDSQRWALLHQPPSLGAPKYSWDCLLGFGVPLTFPLADLTGSATVAEGT